MTEKYLLYQQLADSLRDKICEGKYVFGDKLPSERALAEQFGISHLTVRKALGILEEEGLLLRQQGKGTFVRAQKYSLDMRRLGGFSSVFRQQGMAITNNLLYSGFREAGYKYSRIFGISKEEEVFECIRLRQNQDITLALEYNAVPKKFVPGMEDYDFRMCSLWDIYQKNGIEIVDEEQNLEIIKIFNPQAKLLDMEEGTDVLVLSTLSRDARGNAVEWSRIFDNAKRMVFYVSNI